MAYVRNISSQNQIICKALQETVSQKFQRCQESTAAHAKAAAFAAALLIRQIGQCKINALVDKIAAA